jgi:Fe-S-cluster containining protein
MAPDQKNNPCWPCTNCCTNAIIRIKEDELKKWKKESRQDIILYLEEITPGAIFIIRKKNGECSFLTENGCIIYKDRPEVCRKFPTSKNHAERFNCKLKDSLKEINR